MPCEVSWSLPPPVSMYFISAAASNCEGITGSPSCQSSGVRSEWFTSWKSTGVRRRRRSQDVLRSNLIIELGLQQRLPSGNTKPVSEYDIDLTVHMQSRPRASILGFPLAESGLHTFVVELQDAATGTWQKVSKLPLRMISVPQGACTSPALSNQVASQAGSQVTRDEQQNGLGLHTLRG